MVTSPQCSILIRKRPLTHCIYLTHLALPTSCRSDMSLLTSNPDIEGTICVLNIAIRGIAYGALTTLGVVCLVVLHSMKPQNYGQSWGLRTRQRYLQIHVLLVLIITTLLQIWDVYRIIRENFFTNANHIASFRDWSNIFIALCAMLTDGLLVSTPFLSTPCYLNYLSRSGAVIWSIKAYLSTAPRACTISAGYFLWRCGPRC